MFLRIRTSCFGNEVKTIARESALPTPLIIECSKLQDEG